MACIGTHLSTHARTPPHRIPTAIVIRWLQHTRLASALNQ